MNVVGERVLIVGDSLSHPGPDAGPSIVDVTSPIGLVSSAPGELIARQLLAAGAQAARVNAKVGRSARSFLANESALLARDQNEFRPTKVIIFLGTNDIDVGLTPSALISTATAMAQIRDAYQAMGAEVFALGPPTYPNPHYNDAAPVMFNVIQTVFGAGHTFDIRPFTPGAARTGDGIHFTTVGAAAVAPGIAQMLTASTAVTVAQPMSTGTKVALGVLGVAGFVGLSWLALHVAKRAAQGSGELGTTQKLSRPVIRALERLGPPSKTSDRGARVFTYYPDKGLLRALKLGLAECYTQDTSGVCAYRRTIEGEQLYQEHEAERAPWKKKQLGATDVKLIKRVAQLISYDVSKQDIREQLVAEGYDDDDVFQAHQAAKVYLRRREIPDSNFGALPATKTEFRKQFQKAVQVSEWQGQPTKGIGGKFVAVGDSGWEVRRVYSKHRFGYSKLFDLRKIGHGRSSTQESVKSVADAIFTGEIAASWVDD